MTYSTREIQFLKNLRGLITPSYRWTQEAFARNLKGNKIPSDSPSAVCWCIMGARMKIERQENKSYENVWAYLCSVSLEKYNKFPVDLNDDLVRSPEEAYNCVLAILDVAITELEQEQEQPK
jgi:hypothetical protein